MAYMHTMVHQFHVLLVDHDEQTLHHTTNMLQMNHCIVAPFDAAHTAMPMLLSNEVMKFDVVMVAINPHHDPNGYRLIQHALTMFIPVVWMSDDDSASTAMRALESGAFICINKRALPMEFLECLWQHVIREKIKMLKERPMFVASNNLGTARGIEFRDAVHQPNPNPNPNFMMNNKGKGKGKRSLYQYDGDYNSDNNTVSQEGGVKRKMCTEWTQELHAKFIDTVIRLGEGRCFPKEILEEMDEPGLTRMQVASHLQKCRNDNWRSPEDRKPVAGQGVQQSPARNSVRTYSKQRKFGAMPLLPNKHPFHQVKTGQSSETRTTNNAPKMGQGLPSMTNNASQHYGTSDYFNFSDMDSLINDFPAHQPELENNNPNPTQPAYQVDPPHNDQQNSGEADGKGKSH